MINQTEQTCPTVAYQMSSVCVPVKVTPYARTGATFTKCCGNATVTPGIAVCDGVKNGVCAFTISQNVCIAVPVEFGASAEVGDAYVSCNGATADDVCTDCGQQPVTPTEPPPSSPKADPFLITNFKSYRPLSSQTPQQCCTVDATHFSEPILFLSQLLAALLIFKKAGSPPNGAACLHTEQKDITQ